MRSQLILTNVSRSAFLSVFLHNLHISRITTGTYFALSLLLDSVPQAIRIFASCLDVVRCSIVRCFVNLSVLLLLIASGNENGHTHGDERRAGHQDPNGYTLRARRKDKTGRKGLRPLGNPGRCPTKVWQVSAGG